MGDTVKVTAITTVTITWLEVAHALCSSLALVGVVPSTITDEQLAHLENVIINARTRLRETQAEVEFG